MAIELPLVEIICVSCGEVLGHVGQHDHDDRAAKMVFGHYCEKRP